MGRVSRDERGWRDRVELAERLGAAALTDLRIGAAFPTDHPLHRGPAGLFLSAPAANALRRADVVLSLDWVDLAGTLRQAWHSGQIPARVIQVSLDQFVHNGWALDHQALPPTDLYLLAEPDTAVPALLAALGSGGRPASPDAPCARGRIETAAPHGAGGGITLAWLVRLLREATAREEVSLLHLATGWPADLWPFRHPLDYVGYDGGGGIGSGPGIAVGAALALKGSGRLPVAVVGDGDYLMGLTALWTAAAAKVPLLVVVGNNRSYFNDELHQEHVARERGRPVERRWIGQRIVEPDLDLAALARGQGLFGIGPVETPEALVEALAEAVTAVKRGAACVVDVRMATAHDQAETVVFARGTGGAG
jgi:thiamine pyrophosphate-dependent acetolactate synthase large subunit-like protein